MSWLEAIVLAVVQGATEFLPVSSSGHLVIGSKLLGLEELPLLYVVVVHIGTLAAVLLYYRDDLSAMVRAAFRPATRVSDAKGESANARRLLLFILVGTIPAALVGATLYDLIESLFSQLLPVGIALLVTATILWFSDRMRGERSPDDMTWFDVLCIGAAQAFAILPGISRSGSTIGAGLTRGLTTHWAPRFSFLLSVPAILGAGLLEAYKLIRDWQAGTLDAEFSPLLYIVAGLVSAVVGYISIYIVIDSVKRGSLFKRFGIYVTAAGLLSIIAALSGLG